MASLTASISLGSQLKSGKPWPRLTAFFSAANADMTVKMVVPTLGSLLVRVGVMKLFIGGYKRVTPEFRSASGYPAKFCNCSNLANFLSPNLPVDFTDEDWTFL